MNNVEQIKVQFFNLFWRNKACRGLFLLHRTELLECQRVEFEGTYREVFRPRIIVSNSYDKGESNLTLAVRADNFKLRIENSFELKGKLLQPRIEYFFEERFGKSIEKLKKDLSGPIKPIKFVSKVIKILTDPEKHELLAIEMLRKYGFIGNNINSYFELGAHLERFIKKHFRSIISEEHVFHFFDTVELARFFYYSVMYKSMLKSNKVLVNALKDSEHYQDRIEAISILQDEDILVAGKSETYFQCLNCKPGVALGSIKLEIKVKNMNRFKCPVCSEPFFYLTPLEIHRVIYDLIVQKDGLLISAVEDFLVRLNYKVELNKHFGHDTEIDVIANGGDQKIFIECKMYQLHENEVTQMRKIRSTYDEVIGQLTRFMNVKGHALPNKHYIVTNLPDLALIEKTKGSLKNNAFEAIVEFHTLDSFCALISRGLK